MPPDSVSRPTASVLKAALPSPESAMPSFKSDFLRVLTERGYVHQCTDLEGLDAAAAAGPITAYIGFDATADSLHVGNLVSIMLLRRLQQTGHKPIVVMGGGTTKVGDPSGKDESRRLLTAEIIASNMASIRTAFTRFLSFEGERAAVMVDNAEWLDRLGYIDFLREYGPHFTINRMLTFDSVKLRLEREQPLTFLEFNYMLMQATDFLELARRQGCVLQMGGSDQWGNIVNGVELIRRKDAQPAFGLTTPLITTAAGAKMGKTAAGAMWLNADRLSPYDYWQFWRNTEDADVGRFLKLFTDMPLDDIARLEALQGAEINEAKKILADQATTLLHGREAAGAARAAAVAAFEHGELSDDLPIKNIDRGPNEEWLVGRSNTAILAASGLVSSNSEARRKIAEGAVRINDKIVSDPHETVPWTAVDPATGAFKVQLGKKKIVLVKPA